MGTKYRRLLLLQNASEQGSSTNINVDNYLTIEALEDGLTAKLSTNACEYCVDGDGNWKSLTAGTTTQSINSGHTLSFRGNLTPNGSNGIGTFTISKKCNLKGNCMSMLFGDNAANNYSLSGKNDAFHQLFYGCANIVNVSNNFLPATTLAEKCYASMFYGCSSLTAAPKLPAMRLTIYCYSGMFSDCSSLTTAPSLSATTLVANCYSSMFSGCSNLIAAPSLPATTLADNCYSQMFVYCRNLTTAPELPATTLASNCYGAMFRGCTKLTTAPALPATTLERSCYRQMFYGCTKLTTVPNLPALILKNECYSAMFRECTSLTTTPALPATTLASECYNEIFYGTNVLPDCSNIDFTNSTVVASGGLNGLFAGTKVTDNDLERLLPKNSNGRYYLPVTTGRLYYEHMFQNCTSLTTAPDLPATTLTSRCYANMFQNCTSLTTAPTLPATTLANNCYQRMFSGCTKLNYIKMLATDVSAYNCLGYWVSKVASTGTFVKNPAMTDLPTATSTNAYRGIPEGWTVVDDGEGIN